MHVAHRLVQQQLMFLQEKSQFDVLLLIPNLQDVSNDLVFPVAISKAFKSLSTQQLSNLFDYWGVCQNVSEIT